MLKEDARAVAEFMLSASENHSREQHHLPKATRADIGKKRMFFLIDLLSVFKALVLLDHLTILWSDEPSGAKITGLEYKASRLVTIRSKMLPSRVGCPLFAKDCDGTGDH